MTVKKVYQDFFDALSLLDYNIDRMTELLVREFYLCDSLIKQQSFILQSLKSLRDTLQEEPKKD